MAGYEIIYWNDKTSTSERRIIATKDTMKAVTIQVKQEIEVEQILF